MSDYQDERAKEILAQINYATIASVTPDGLPWNSPVFATYDDNYNFYWGTHKESQKAKNIDANENVFLVIYDSTVPPGTGEGVYIQATAKRVADPEELKKAFEILKWRHDKIFWDFKAVSDKGPIAIYKAAPQKVWMNDGDRKHGHYIDTRTEVNLS